MKITEILDKEGLFLSFEVFPPKTSTAYASVKEATEKIAELKPSFVSVTYGAGGGTSQYTLDIARNSERSRAITAKPPPTMWVTIFIVSSPREYLGSTRAHSFVRFISTPPFL